MTRYFTNAYASFRKGPSTSSPKWQDLPEKTVVESVFNPDPWDLGWFSVEYMGKLGYIANTLIEPYVENLPKDCVKIDNQTPEQNDWEQFFYYKGFRQYNFCGPISICYALGLSLKDFNDTWEIKAPSLWKRIRGGGKFSGTTPQDLRQMCEAYTVSTEKMETVTFDPWLKRSRYTPATLQRLTETGFSIVACKIDGSTGRLRGSGIGHWVVVKKVEPERTGGIVTIYNPAPNRDEQYSYEEAIASMNQPYGIWIPKSAV